MTKEEAIDILKTLWRVSIKGGPIEKALEVTIQTLEEQQWIPCSEKLPEVGQSVLMSVGGVYTAEGDLREDGDWSQYRWDAVQRKDMVEAWMPLPKAWNGK